MIEGRMDHAVSPGRATPQAFQIPDVSAMRLGTSGDERLGAGIRADKAEHLMARSNEFPHDGGTDKTGGTCNEHTHHDFSLSS
jgi:hypothetical protein